MQNKQSIMIADRFWLAYESLRENRARGFQTEFIEKSKADIGNFIRGRKDHSRELELYFLELICDYGVNPDWLLTGKGEMFIPGEGKGDEFFSLEFTSVDEKKGKRSATRSAIKTKTPLILRLTRSNVPGTGLEPAQP